MLHVLPLLKGILGLNFNWQYFVVYQSYILIIIKVITMFCFKYRNTTTTFLKNENANPTLKMS